MYEFGAYTPLLLFCIYNKQLYRPVSFHQYDNVRHDQVFTENLRWLPPLCTPRKTIASNAGNAATV